MCESYAAFHCRSSAAEMLEIGVSANVCPPSEENAVVMFPSQRLDW